MLLCASDNHFNRSNCSHVTVTSGLAFLLSFSMCVAKQKENVHLRTKSFSYVSQRFKILLIIKFLLFLPASRTCWASGFRNDMDTTWVLSPKGFWRKALNSGFWFAVSVYWSQKHLHFFLSKGEELKKDGGEQQQTECDRLKNLSIKHCPEHTSLLSLNISSMEQLLSKPQPRHVVEEVKIKADSNVIWK